MAFFTILEAVISVLLILSVLLQQRTSGLSSTFGGSGVTFVQRRGAEKLLYQGTIVLAIAFFAIAILQWYTV